MSVLNKYFDKSVNQCSPVAEDFNRVVNYDENGNEFITYQKVDYKKIQESNGTVDMWSLNSLLSAGINPNFPIHTGLNTRLEGVSIVNDMVATADAILADASESAE